MLTGMTNMELVKEFPECFFKPAKYCGLNRISEQT